MTSISATNASKTSLLAIPSSGAGDKIIERVTPSSLPDPKEPSLDKRIEDCRLAYLGLDTLKITDKDEKAKTPLLNVSKEALELTAIT